MYTTICGYQVLAKLYESNHSIIYRVQKQNEKKPFILKLLQDEYPNSQDIARFKKEYQLTHNFTNPSIIKSYSLEKHQNRLAIIFEDFAAISLKQLITEKLLSFTDFLNIAIKITDSLIAIHSANIIHKDINPANIVINLETGQLKIIDFGISTQLTREHPTLKNPEILEGTLAYISPEQTGRMNRFVDYRTDFYSLGVTLYEILTGQLPFACEDALSIVHCHIAKQPQPPHTINPEIAPVISEIIIKLMAKTAEKRYQGAWGIKADLVTCLNQLTIANQISSFTLGTQDISDKFQINQKLYGREAEVNNLLAAFDRVSSINSCSQSVTNSNQCPREMMLVTGYSGIGKSSLVQEIHKPITAKRGYFISGKFEQLQRNTPYLAFFQALTSLVRELFTESERKLQQWRKEILAAVGENGKVIIDVIPELKLIIGEQPELSTIEAEAAQNRFNLTFQNFIKVFCSLEHPLVIFIDDLQWVDAASLKLIELLVTNPDIKYLFLIGAYRNNEMSSTHPLMMTLDNLERQGTKIHQITLASLTVNQVRQLIAETLHTEEKTVEALAELVIRKTDGNPFFVNEFFKNLYSENLLKFGCDSLQWEWDMAEIAARDITDNVVDLMIGKLKRLPMPTQQALRLAACIGANFNLYTLSIICEKSAAVVATDLKAALDTGLILPTTELDSELLIQNYKFLHDRVQQAAYALIDDINKTVVHLQIGRLLLSNLTPSECSERIFEVVDHLNQGRSEFATTQEQVKLAYLNLEAAQKAKESTAYDVARKYLITGRECLTDDSWKSNYDSTLIFYKELAVIEYLNCNFENSENIINLLLERVKSPLEQAEICNTLIVQYTMQGKYQAAIQTGRKALALVGVNLPKSDLKSALEAEIAEANLLLQDREIASLIDHPEMTSPDKKLAVRLLMNIDVPAYLSDAELYPVIVGKMTNLSLKYGSVPESAKAYVTYGLVQGAIFSNYQIGYQFGLLGVKVSEKFNSQAQKCKSCLILANQITSWVKHIKYVDQVNNEGYQAGLESGEFQFAGYIIMYQLLYPLYAGINLAELTTKIPGFLNFSDRIKNQLAIDTILGCKLIIFNLTNQTSNNINFDVDNLTEAEYITASQENKSFLALCQYYVLKSQTLYLYGNYSEALTCALSAEKQLFSTLGLITVAEHNFYYSLILAALYPSVAVAEQQQYWERLEVNRKQMKIWADNCPENFLHKYVLIQAEMARICGKGLDAIDLYDRAIALAQSQEYIQEAALANELAAKFFLSRGKEKIAGFYLAEAHYCYSCWGAIRKVEDLEKNYPRFFENTPSKARISNINLTNSSVTTNTTASEVFDLAALMKASQAIASEIFLDKLLASLIKILLQISGAQRGCLILESQGKYLIEAEGEIENKNFTVLQSLPLRDRLPESLINYVINTRNTVLKDNAVNQGKFTNDAYIQTHQTKSILGAPLIHQGKLCGIVYLENNLTANTFTPKRLEIIQLLSSQAAIAIDNAKLYAEVIESEKQLRRTQQQLAQFLEAIPVGVFIVDASGQPYYANQTARNILGQGVVPNALKDNLAEVYQVYIAGTEQEYPNQQMPVVRALKGESATVDDIEIHQVDTIIPIEVWGTPIYEEEGNVAYAMAAFQDITARKQAEKFLAEYNRTLEATVAERTQELERALEDLKATQIELIQSEKMAALGQLIAGIAHEINTPLGAIRASISNIVSATDTSLEKLPVLLQQLSPHQITDFLSLIEIAKNNQQLLSSREERQLRRSLRKELEVQGVEDADAIADTLVPMGITTDITRFLPLLQDNHKDLVLEVATSVSSQIRNSDNIMQAVERASKIVFALKSYARQDLVGEMVKGNIAQGIDVVLTLYQNQLKQGIDLVKNYQIVPSILCYPDQLNQVWTNLIHNAIQAMNNLGKLEIKILSLSKEVIVQITDSGCGIPPEITDKIFQPFFTTKPAGEGSGLGLDIVMKIIDLHQGRIEVDSQPGQTTFSVFLPIK